MVLLEQSGGTGYHGGMKGIPSGGRRVAFFGGSFDPPHRGHLAVARAAQRALELDTVLFAPVGAQPLKPRGATASFEDRLAMTRLAIAGEPEFAVSLADAPKATGETNYTPNYTIDTLLGLRAELEPGSALFCLMGADAFASLRRWHRAAEIPFAAALIVASRPGERLGDLTSCLPEGVTVSALPRPERDGAEVEVRRSILRNEDGELAPLYVLPGLDIAISASEIRAQARSEGQAAGGQNQEGAALPSSVSEYIRAHGLYR